MDDRSIDPTGSTQGGRTFSRRAVVRTAAWSVPVISLATAAPAFAASGDMITLNSPPTAFTSGDWGYGPLNVTVKNAGAAPVAGATVSFTSSQAWVSPIAATALTNASGVATMLLKFNSVPTDGATATLTASYDTASGSGIVSVLWTVTYQPLTVAQRIALGTVPASGSVYRQVRGFIRGNQTGTTSVNTTPPFSNDTNLVLADTNTETSYLNMVPVELTTAGNLRNTWGLQTTPGNQNTRVDVTGDALAYFSRPGIKDDTSGTTITIIAAP